MQLSTKARKALAVGVAASTVLMTGAMGMIPSAFAASHNDGCLVLANGTVWLITNGERRGFTSAEVFMSHGYNFGQVVAANADDTALPVGAIEIYADGTLVKGPSDPLVYLVVNGQKRGFTSGSVFTGLGYSFANIQWAPVNTFSDIPTGSNIDSTSITGLPHSGPGPQTVNCGTGSGSGSTTLNGGAGDATVTKTSTDVEDTVKEGDSNVKVFGFKVEAEDSDIAVKSVKVELEEQGQGGSQRLDHYVDSVSVWEGSNKVGSADASDFTKDGTLYSKSISLDSDAIVREGSDKKQTFYVAVTALDNIDSNDLGAANNDWMVTIPSIRFEDAQGAVLTNTDLTDNSEDSADFSFETLAGSGDVTVTVSKASGNPDDQNVEVSDTASTKNVLLLQFKVKTEGSEMTFDTVDFDWNVTSATTSVNDMVSELQLRNGTSSSSDLLATEDSTTTNANLKTDGTVRFSLDDDFTIDADSTETFSVYATVNDVDNFTEGDSAEIDFQDFNNSLVDQNGDEFADADVDGSATGSTLTFFSEGAQVEFVSDDFTAEDTSGSPAIDGTISMKVKITAFGNNDITLADDCSDITYTLDGGTDDGCIITSSTTTKDNADNFTISAGDTETFTIAVKFSDQSGFVQLHLDSVGTTDVSNVETQAF